MKIIKTECLVLNKREIGESDLSVTLFSKKLGKISGTAFGIRSSKKRSPVSLNPLNLIEVTLQKRNEYYTVTESEIIKNFKNIARDIEKLEISLYILDSINRIYDVTYRDEDFFHKIVQILEFIENTGNLTRGYKYFIILSFLRRLMIEQGIYENDEISALLGLELLLKYREITSVNRGNGRSFQEIQKNMEKYTDSLKKIITIFENYINRNLQAEIKVKKFLMEDW